MSFGALAFLNPALLGALALLPVIYWLLRTVPPRPRRIEFPATRILVGIDNREKTPAKTPWWLTLIRMLAAAFVDPGAGRAGAQSQPRYRAQGQGTGGGGGRQRLVVGAAGSTTASAWSSGWSTKQRRKAGRC